MVADSSPSARQEGRATLFSKELSYVIDGLESDCIKRIFWCVTKADASGKGLDTLLATLQDEISGMFTGEAKSRDKYAYLDIGQILCDIFGGSNFFPLYPSDRIASRERLLDAVQRSSVASIAADRLAVEAVEQECEGLVLAAFANHLIVKEKRCRQALYLLKQLEKHTELLFLARQDDKGDAAWQRIQEEMEGLSTGKRAWIKDINGRLAHNEDIRKVVHHSTLYGDPCTIESHFFF